MIIPLTSSSWAKLIYFTNASLKLFKLFLQYFTGKQLISTYILGGVFGGLIYIIAFNIFPVFKSFPYVGSVAIGASASVLAIFIAIATCL